MKIKIKTMIQILFIIIFIGILVSGLYAKINGLHTNYLSYLPEQLTFESVLFSLLPAVYYSDLDESIIKNTTNNTNTLERKVAYIFTFLFLVLYILYMMRLTVLFYRVVFLK